MNEKMNKKSGFTLIEVLGVLVIVCIIFVLVFPNILNQFKKSEDAIDEATQKLIVEATKDYMNQNSVEYSAHEEATYCIAFSDLLDNGFIDDKQIKNLDEMKDYIKIIYNKESSNYALTDACTPTYKSMILLNGDASVSVALNGTYTESGAYAMDADANDISELINTTIYNSDGLVVNDIDANSLGKYIVKYSVINDDIEISAERTVKIVDTISPVVTTVNFPDNIDDTVSTFDFTSYVTVTDNSGETITPTVSTNLSLGVPGTYKIKYTAVDSSNNKKTIERSIQVYASALSYASTSTTTSYDATVSTSTYAATVGQNYSSCRVTRVTNYGNCCYYPCSSVDYTDDKYHIGYCDNGEAEYNTVCGYGVKIGDTHKYNYYDVYICSTGDTLSGSTCTKTTYTCPNGGTLDGTTCTVTTYTCPNGGILDGTICNR